MALPLIIVTSLAAAGAFQTAAPAAAGAPAAARAPAPSDRIICQVVHEIGSRLNRQRLCGTRAQWDEQRRTERLNVEHAQTNRIWPAG